MVVAFYAFALVAEVPMLFMMLRSTMSFCISSDEFLRFSAAICLIFSAFCCLMPCLHLASVAFCYVFWVLNDNSPIFKQIEDILISNIQHICNQILTFTIIINYFNSFRNVGGDFV